MPLRVLTKQLQKGIQKDPSQAEHSQAELRPMLLSGGILFEFFPSSTESDPINP